MSTAVPAAASEAPDAGANSAEQTTTEAAAITAAAAAVAATITDPPANAAELRRQRGAARRALEKEVAAATRQASAHERLLDQEARRAAATALDGDRAAQQVTDEFHESPLLEQAGRALQRDCARRLREAKAKAARKSAAAWAPAAPVASESTEVRARIDSFLDKPLPAAAATAPSASAARPPRDLEASFLGRFGKLLDEYEECAEPLRGIVEEADASNDAFEEMLGGAEPAVPARAKERAEPPPPPHGHRRRRRRRPASGGGADTSMMTHPASACRARRASTAEPNACACRGCRRRERCLTWRRARSRTPRPAAARGAGGPAPPGAENARAKAAAAAARPKRATVPAATPRTLCEHERALWRRRKASSRGGRWRRPPARAAPPRRARAPRGARHGPIEIVECCGEEYDGYCCKRHHLDDDVECCSSTRSVRGRSPPPPPRSAPPPARLRASRG